MRFPKGFVFGAASSAYQVEGAADVDGRGPSVWDEFCRRPGAVHQGESGAVACDHYHRYREDVSLMRSIGLRAYRLSLSWPRILPDGTGRINEAGLAFYDRLIDELLGAGIEPWVTLFHWDMPSALFRRGGWLNHDSAGWFADYAELATRRLSDRVRHWITLNEPQVFIGLGHADGKHAPGLKLSFPDCLRAAHHALLGHGRAVLAMRGAARRPLSIGWSPVGHISCPATDSPADIEAARTAMFSVRRRDFWNNTWFADPVCRGRYPDDGVRLFGEDMPRIADSDLETIHQPLDFYGVNIYSGGQVKAGPGGEPVDIPAPPGAPTTTFRWLIRPEVLNWGPRLLAERYGLPITITENGMANVDTVDLDGRVQDPQRIDFTRRHLLELGRAARDGVNVLGYFHWSILDNFEWAEGYRERFGLIHVDYATQRRTLKDSAHWYRRVIATHGEVLSAGVPGTTIRDSAPELRPVVRAAGGSDGDNQRVGSAAGQGETR